MAIIFLFIAIFLLHDGTDNGRTVLHFQLRREKEKLNPEPWLNR